MSTIDGQSGGGVSGHQDRRIAPSACSRPEAHRAQDVAAVLLRDAQAEPFDTAAISRQASITVSQSRPGKDRLTKYGEARSISPLTSGASGARPASRFAR